MVIIIKQMQSQYSSPQHIRNSYGFSMQGGFPGKVEPKKGFPVDGSKTPNHQRQEHLASAIRNLEDSNASIDSPQLKKFNAGKESPFLSGQGNSGDSKFKAVFPGGKETGGESPGDQFLRGSCSNVLRKF